MSVEVKSLKWLITFAAISTSVGCVYPGFQLTKQADEREGWYAGVESQDAQADKTAEQIEIIPLTAQTVLDQARYRSADRVIPRSVVPNKPDSQYSYKIGPRDVLTIIVWGHPELTIPAGEFRSEESSGRRVSADGKIFFPFAGELDVKGKTPGQVRALVARKLRPFIKDPQIDVRVAAYRSKRVYVTGEVNQPGTQYLGEEPPRLLDIIGKAGGLTDEADRRIVQLTRDGKRYDMDLNLLYRQGDADLNVLLTDGDTVHVPDNRSTRVFVIGEVERQIAVPMINGQLSLADALADVEGIKLDTADASKIYVMRGLRLTSEWDGEADAQLETAVFQLDAESPDAIILADRFELQPRDVVYVSSTPLTRWNRLVNQILPSISALFQTSVFIRAVD